MKKTTEIQQKLKHFVHSIRVSYTPDSITKISMMSEDAKATIFKCLKQKVTRYKIIFFEKQDDSKISGMQKKEIWRFGHSAITKISKMKRDAMQQYKHLWC